MRRGLKLSTAIGAIGLGAGALAMGARKLGDFDLPYHLSLGRLFASRWRPPLVEELSYTAAGQPAPDELLSDLFLYYISRGGPFALQLLGVLLVGALAFLLVRGARHTALGIACASLALIAASPWLIVRPALISFVLLAASLILVERGRIWWCVPLQLLWANLHGFAIVGAALVVAHALLSRSPRRIGIAALAVLATMLSPYGPAIFIGPFRVSGVGRLITEWTPLSIDFLWRHDPALAILMLLAVASLLARPRPSLWEAGLVLGTLALAVRGVRLVPLFCVVAAPICARRLAPILDGKRALGALVAATGLAVAPALLTAPGTRIGVGFDETQLPLGAADWIAARRPSGRLYNFLPFGGWLGWRLYPPTQVFLDGRTAWVHAPELVTQAVAAESDPRAFAALDGKWSFEWAVVRARPGERLGAGVDADPRFAMVYLDDCAAVYVRRDGPNAALAAEGYRVIRHLSAPDLRRVARDDLAHDAALASEQAPASLRTRFLVEAAR